MIQLRRETIEAYGKRLNEAGVPERNRPDFQKWVRYYLDFCEKYGHPPRHNSSLPAFLTKLEAKGQTALQRDQARNAVDLLISRRWRDRRLNLSRSGKTQSEEGSSDPAGRAPRVAEAHTEMRESREKSKNPPVEATVHNTPGATQRYSSPAISTNSFKSGTSWENEFRELEGAIKIRGYSKMTFKVYRGWVQKFQAFVASSPPGEVTTEDVKIFLTELAVKHGVAAATQNQAFNSLLFFFRHVLKREFGKLDGVVRAKRRPYIPVVLSLAEVEAVIRNLEPPYRLVVALLYGCGLRLSECLELRVHCLNFDAMLVTVHDGKGKKDRTVPLPKKLVPELQSHIAEVRRRHEIDLAEKYSGVFLPGQLEKKYKNAPREWIWQWIFPAAKLTAVSKGNELRRYHLHGAHVQAAVKKAAEKAGIPKRVSPHTFRHTFASHLLLANYDIQTIQKLMGHGDVKTTMIYLQTVPSITLKEAKSPMDLGEFSFEV